MKNVVYRWFQRETLRTFQAFLYLDFHNKILSTFLLFANKNTFCYYFFSKHIQVQINMNMYYSTMLNTRHYFSSFDRRLVHKRNIMFKIKYISTLAEPFVYIYERHRIVLHSERARDMGLF